MVRRIVFTQSKTSTVIVFLNTQVIEAVSIILDKKYYPLYVCCNLGRHRTGTATNETESFFLCSLCYSSPLMYLGTVIGCLRKIQRWNLTSILGLRCAFVPPELTNACLVLYELFSSRCAEEYRRYAGQKVGLTNEQFIELFDTDLVTRANDESTPDWI